MTSVSLASARLAKPGKKIRAFAVSMPIMTTLATTKPAITARMLRIKAHEISLKATTSIARGL